MPKPKKWKGKIKKKRGKLACPKCLSTDFEILGEEFTTMAKYPFLLRIKCKKCGYEGEAIKI
ncbi:MAG: hypothetical protein QMD14_00385 [Candidatus Aenigmarchaeota archaeon]|nr:hypothetical protein [Candidatus Aenigmarchaeota archaeon]